jgi:hypothetical protein
VRTHDRAMRAAALVALPGLLLGLLIASALASEHAGDFPQCPDGAIEWSGNDGAWSDPANWPDESVPTATDDACIPAGVTVTVDVAAEANSLVSLGNLVVNMPLALGEAPSGVSGTLTIGSATISVSESLLVAGDFTWNGGGFSGDGTVVLEGDTTVAGFGQRSSSAGLVNEGDIAWNSGVSLVVPEGAELTNDGSWTFNASFGSIFSASTTYNFEFINNGALAKAGDTGTTTIYALTNTSTGTVQVDVGTLSIARAAALEDGSTLSAAADAVLHLAGPFSWQEAVPASMNMGTTKPTDRSPCGIPSAVVITGSSMPNITSSKYG